MPNRTTGRSVTSGSPPAPRMSPRSGSTVVLSSDSPSASVGSTRLGVQVACQASPSSASDIVDSYSHVWSPSVHVQASVASAFSLSSVTSATSTSGSTSPSPATIASYSA